MYFKGVSKVVGKLINVMHSSTPAPPTTISVISIIITSQCQQLKKLFKSLVKVEYIADLLYWIALDCTGV